MAWLAFYPCTDYFMSIIANFFAGYKIEAVWLLLERDNTMLHYHQEKCNRANLTRAEHAINVTYKFKSLQKKLQLKYFKFLII